MCCPSTLSYWLKLTALFKFKLLIPQLPLGIRYHYIRGQCCQSPEYFLLPFRKKQCISYSVRFWQLWYMTAGTYNVTFRQLWYMRAGSIVESTPYTVSLWQLWNMTIGSAVMFIPYNVTFWQLWTVVDDSWQYSYVFAL